jgi:hypothetical protein
MSNQLHHAHSQVGPLLFHLTHFTHFPSALFKGVKHVTTSLTPTFPSQTHLLPGSRQSAFEL